MMITRHADTTPRPTHGKQRERATTQPRTNAARQLTNSPPAVSHDGANNEEKQNGQQGGTRNGTGTIRNPTATKQEEAPHMPTHEERGRRPRRNAERYTARTRQSKQGETAEKRSHPSKPPMSKSKKRTSRRQGQDGTERPDRSKQAKTPRPAI